MNEAFVPPAPLLQCFGLTKRYGSAPPALQDVSLTLYGGRIIGLLGPNGSGKSTLIKLISGLLVPTSGQVLVNGIELGTESRLSIAYLPERTYLTPSMTVEKTLRFFCDFYSNFNRPRAEAMLAQLGISLSTRISTMSKGTREKLQLILVMSRDADLYLLDEPIAGVDPAARDAILHTILTSASPAASIILSTHLISDVEPVLTDAIFLDRGRVILADAADTIRERNHRSLDQLFREVFRC